MKKFLIFLTTLLSMSIISAQNNTRSYYYANGKAHYWVDDSTSVNIIVRNMSNYNQIVANLETLFNNEKVDILSDNSDDNIIVNCDNLSNYSRANIIAAISVNSDDISFFSYAKNIKGSKIWLRPVVLIKLKDISDTPTIMAFLETYTLDSVVQEDESEYIIYCQSEEDVLNLANGLYELGVLEYSTPDFYSEMYSNTSDTYFNQQWALKNEGINDWNIWGWGIDINANNAWTFVQAVGGNDVAPVKVAVVDDGVEQHVDLYKGGGVSVLQSGFTAGPGGGSGSPATYGKHGQCCAGIIAAVHNNIGIAGVATNSLLYPIKIFKDKLDKENHILPYSNYYIGQAIKKAWQDFNAAVLSCSWGSDDPSDYLTKKIIEAMNDGRNGKGCVVVFSSGNTNTNVSYPANVNPNILVVGAIDRCGDRAGTSDVFPNSCDPWSGKPGQGSNFGPTLDVVAPGSNNYTIDREGNQGYADNFSEDPNYYAGFGGTSAACPHVAGIAALILSVNSSLTGAQVRNIIETTAYKNPGHANAYYYENSSAHPNGTWNEELGYGLVNAYAAVVKTYFDGHNITGDNSINWCQNKTITYNHTLPLSFYIQWETSPHFSIVSGQNTNSVTVRVVASHSSTPFIRAKVMLQQVGPVKYFIKNITIQPNSPLGTVQPATTIQNGQMLTLSSNYHFSGNLNIESGGTLKLNNATFSFAKNCQIIVKDGGALEVNGAILSNDCSNEMWEGINIEPGAEALITNNATIKNALIAINASSAANKTSMVRAFNTTFLNNAIAAH
ncbi:MAG: S8 family serine peptidase, partial [Bacteroidales bacterium]|nr:S8 family serine peptidase [Bacteroidales bacterium]